MAVADSNTFSVPRLRGMLKDLFGHQPLIYWTDFLLTIAIGYTAASIYLAASLFSVQQVACLLIAGFALFRAGSFVHEIIHLPGKEMRSFVIGWNILAGIPMLMPSFFYGNHIDHHSTRRYGTGKDGEYLPLGSGPLQEVLYFYLQVLVLPLAILTRFLVVTPVSLMHPTIRNWALERYSSYVFNLRYRYTVSAHAPRRAWALMECCCCVRAWFLVGLWAVGLVPFSRLPLIYVLAVLTLGLNYIRNLVAHRYESDGRPMSHIGQLEDSINLEGLPLVTELFFPLGLRYHALHHLFPTLPYHNLGAAHRRLMMLLPVGSSYHRTVMPGFWARATQLVRRARASKQFGAAPEERLYADQWYARRAELLTDARPLVDSFRNHAHFASRERNGSLTA